MRWILFWLSIIVPISAIPQETISVDAQEPMRVCSATVAPPCATAPKAIGAPDPTYSDEARRARLQGTVLLAIIVAKDGLARDIRVEKSLGSGLDEQAVSAVRQWKFAPGTYNGSPVPTQIHVEVNFRLTAGVSDSTSASQNSASSVASEVNNLFTGAADANNRHDYQTAADLARRITTLAPQNSNGWNLLGVTLLTLHQWDAAASALRRAIDLSPGSSFAYNNLGRVYWAQHKYDEAAVQFQKQIVVNSKDPYAHANLGMMLRDEKKCDAAMPELQKALAITPSHSGVLLAMGECDLEKGDKAKGFSEIEQAASASPSSGTWNGAAYILAKHNVELARAEKWAQDAINMQSIQLRSISLDHLLPTQFSLVNGIAAQWDTLGWVYFVGGDPAKAAGFVQASWDLRTNPIVGDHLGQIWEKLNRTEDARRVYAMAIVGADDPLARESAETADAVAHATERLSALGESKRGLRKLLENSRKELQERHALMLPNITGKAEGGDFILKFSNGKVADVRRISGDRALDSFDSALMSTPLALQTPAGTTIEIPARGTLQCASSDPQCRFVLFSPQEAWDLAMKESSSGAATLQAASTADPHVYNNAAMGVQLSLPDGWQLLTDQPGNFSRPHNVFLKKTDTLAMMVLTRERLESSPDLYRKMLDNYFSGQEEFSRTADKEITQDGIRGTRWDMTWKQKGITYKGVVEFFSVGDDHYRMTAAVPSELYPRYQQDFEDLLRTVKFPLLHVDSKLLDPSK